MWKNNITFTPQSVYVREHEDLAHPEITDISRKLEQGFQLKLYNPDKL